MTAQRQDHTTTTRPYVAPVTGHCPANATYRGHTDTDSHGRRHHWTIPSESQPGVVHDLWSGPGGEEPSCTCYGYRTHGHCGMTDGLPVLLGTHYRARAARLSDERLRLLDREYAGKSAAGTLTATDKLAWGAAGDCLNERRGAA
jgi:hypothetical protein